MLKLACAILLVINFVYASEFELDEATSTQVQNALNNISPELIPAQFRVRKDKY
jgi:hypothetical protein